MKTGLASRSAEATRLRGFTLLELVVVIVIILLISVLVLPTVFASLHDRKFSDAARTLQAVFVAARDRAVQSRNPVGVRLVRDETDPWTVSTLQYVGMVEPYSVGTVRTNGYAVESERKYTAASVDPHFEQVDPGKNGILHDADDIPRVDAIWNPPITTQIRTQRSFIRFDFSGRLYRIVQVETGTSPAELVLDNSGPVPPVLGFGTQYQIFGPPIPVPQTEGVLLPEGIVIDVRFAPIVTGHPFEPDPTLNIPRSKGIPNQVPPAAMAAAVPGTWPRMEILFSPNGQVIGDAAAQPLIHFWVGERGDKGPDPVASRGTDGMPRTTDDVRPTRHHMLVTLNTRTAAVTVQHNPGTASLAAWPPPANSPPDFYADMYRTAEELLGVSVLP